MKKENNLLKFKEFTSFVKNDKPTKRTEIGGDILKEELNPNTYISAGEKLQKKGHGKRGEELIKKGRSPHIPDNHISYIGERDGKGAVSTVSIDDIEIKLQDGRYGSIDNLDEYDFKENRAYIGVYDKTKPLEGNILYVPIIILQIDKKDGIYVISHGYKKDGTYVGYKTISVDTRKDAVVLYKMIKEFLGDKNIDIRFSVNDLYREKDFY